MPDRANARHLTEKLLAWYRAHARVLPWRSDPTPYHVLLSELMLQQTRVETVIPYYQRFLARWPSLEAFAMASEEDVLHAWAGLGYYSRARNLLRAAQAAVAVGGLSNDPARLRDLPGVGPYTAGAIASIAFGRATPLVDGNVERVLCRVDARHADPRRGEGKRALWARADDLVREASAPGDLNQALMELGATICTARSPTCGACPVQSDCLAHASGSPADLPNVPKKPAPKRITGVAGLLIEGGGVLLGQRGPGPLRGTWEPIGAWERGTTADTVRAAFSRRAGLDVRVEQPLGDVVHVFTHRHLTLRVFAVSRVRAGPLGGDGSYIALRFAPDPGAVALSTLAKKILSLGADTVSAQ